MDRAALELLSPDRAAAEGAALGQLACELPGGGLLITASRLVEFGARATILLAPGLFRLDFTPQEETLGLYPRPLGPGRSSGARTRRPGTATATRRARRRSSCRPLRRAACEAWIHVLSFTERDALATHFVAKAEIRPLRSSGAQREDERLRVAARAQRVVGGDRLLEGDRHRVVADRARSSSRAASGCSMPATADARPLTCSGCGSTWLPLTRWPGAVALGSWTLSAASPAVGDRRREAAV